MTVEAPIYDEIIEAGSTPDRRLRITIVQGAFLPVPPVLGGAVEKIWFSLGKEFVRRGHQVTHISRHYSTLANEEHISGVRHIRIPGFDTPSSLLQLKWRDLVYSRRVMKVLPEADVLVTNTFWLPMLLRDPSPGKIYVHVARYPKGQMKFYRNAARLQTVSSTVATAICQEAPALRSRVKVIPYFVESCTADVANKQRSARILYVGRVHPEKGIHLLLEAFDRLVSTGISDWKLRIVGPWEVKHGGGGEKYFSELQKQSQKFANLVEWSGPVFDSEALRAHYRESALFVYPSLAERGETFGLAPLEAMAEGCPPVVSSLDCFQDFIKSEFNGWTFDHRTNAAANLATVLSRLVRNADSLAEIGDHAMKTARAHGLARIADSFLNDFEELTCQ